MRSRLPLSRGYARAALAGLWITIVPLSPAHAQGDIPVAIELVLAIDCSYSVNDREYALQMRGIADALRDPEVSGLIGSHRDGVALSIFHWAGTINNKVAVPWRRLKERDAILSFAAEVEAAPRSSLGYFTGIGHAISFGIRQIEENVFVGRERKIDISGDGRSNSGPEPHEMRLVAMARGITINGLVVVTNDPSIEPYYARHVAIGPASFVVKAENYDDFAAAMKRKLLRELNPQVARLDLAPLEPPLSSRP